MRRRMTQLVILVVACTWAIHAKGGPQKPGSALTSAPSKARFVTNPFGNSESARAAGRKLFARHCSECHGRTAEGTTQAPTLRDISKGVTPGMLQWFIKKGNLRAGMPSWSRLPDQQLWQLVTYLQTLEN